MKLKIAVGSMVVNLNEEVHVRLTPYGIKILSQHYEGHYERNTKSGWTKFPLHMLMNVFSSEMYPGAKICFIDNEIQFAFSTGQF